MTRGGGSGGHLFHAGEGLLEPHHRAVELFPGIEILADVPGGVARGLGPSLPAADRNRLPGIEHRLFAINHLIPQHQVAVGPVQVDEFLFRGLVDGIGSPAGDDPLQRIHVVAAMVGIGAGGEQGPREQRERDGEMSHGHKVRKKAKKGG